MPISSKDKGLTRLFMAGNFHRWDLLEPLCKICYDEGAAVPEVRGAIRHMIVSGGYGPCLATTLHLYKAKMLPDDAVGKVGGPPGNAFELVYEEVTDKVREKMTAADPVLAEYIRLHLYGDVYSSPGLDLRQKQLLMVSFLAEADMHDQLFGHLLAALRFGNDPSSCLKAIDIAFEIAPRPSSSVYKSAMKTLAMACQKFKKDMAETNNTRTLAAPEVIIPDITSVRLPPLPELVNSSKIVHSRTAMLQELRKGESEVDKLDFAWEEVTPKVQQQAPWKRNERRISISQTGEPTERMPEEVAASTQLPAIPVA